MPVASSPLAIDLSHGWEVTFGKDAKRVKMDTLSSWTDNDSTRYFSGVAVYEKEVSVPADAVKDAHTVQIVFGAESKAKTQAGAEEMPADITEQPRSQTDTMEAMRAPTRPGPRMQAVLDAPVARGGSGLHKRQAGRIGVVPAV